MTKKEKETDFTAKRKLLVSEMLAAKTVKSENVKNAFLSVQRENFFPEPLKQFAYADSAFPIGFGQTISQPTTVAMMLEMLRPKKGEKILEVGAGSGYALALLSRIAGKSGQVFAVEKLEGLCSLAEKNLAAEKITNVKIFHGDGKKGIAKEAPFDRILVSAACDNVPRALFEQLKIGGALVAPVGENESQNLEFWAKTKAGPELRDSKGLFVFVPLV